VLQQVLDNFIIYNPSSGKLELLSFDYLEDHWISERYGRAWFIHPTSKQIK
jgi:HEPN domain-containing protein